MFYLTPISLNPPLTSTKELLQLPEYILLLPIFILISIVFHYIIGWRNSNLGLQLILTYAFLEAIRAGNSFFTFFNIFFLTVFLVFLLVSVMLIAAYFKNLTMHYKAKLGLIIATISILSLIPLTLIKTIIPLEQIELSPFVIIALIISFESYIKQIIRKGVKKTLSLIFFTFIIITLNILLGTNEQFKALLIKYPISISAVLITFVIGFWKAFRLSEYYRFWELLNKETSDDQENN